MMSSVASGSRTNVSPCPVTGSITRTWKQVIQFRPEAPARVAERPRLSRPEPEPVPLGPMLDDARREFVRDTRGVWLPREADD